MHCKEFNSKLYALMTWCPPGVGLTGMSLKRIGPRIMGREEARVLGPYSIFILTESVCESVASLCDFVRLCAGICVFPAVGLGVGDWGAGIGDQGWKRS